MIMFNAGIYVYHMYILNIHVLYHNRKSSIVPDGENKYFKAFIMNDVFAREILI